MTRRYPDLGSASDWLNKISNAARSIRSTTQIWVVTRHQYEISALVSQMSFGVETSGSVAKCRLFSQATNSMAVLKLIQTGLILLHATRGRLLKLPFYNFKTAHNTTATKITQNNNVLIISNI